MDRNNNSKAIKSGIWYTLSNFIVKSIGFLTTPIFTRLLTKSDFGLYNNYTSWLSIMTILATMQFESTLISAKYDYEKDFDKYILSVLTLSTIITTLWLLFLNIFIKQSGDFMGLDKVYINTMMVYLLFLPAINMYQARERYYFKYKNTVITSLFLTIGTALLSVLLVGIMQNKLTGRILGSVIPTLMLGFIFYVYFIRIGWKPKITYWKYALPICLPYIPHLLSLTMLNSMDRIMINKWCGAEDAAIYSLAYNCGMIVTLLLTSLNSAFAPWLGEKLYKKKYNEIKTFSKKYIMTFLFFAIGIMLVAPEVLFILGGNDYTEAKYVMTPVAMGCVCQFLYTMFVNVEQFKKKTAHMAIASVLAAIVNFILNYIFIPEYGYLAAAYTTLVGYICLLLIHMYIVYKLGLSNIYDYNYITIITLLGLVSTVFVTLLYSYMVLRYIVIIFYLLALVVIFIQKKEELIKLIRGK